MIQLRRTSENQHFFQHRYKYYQLQLFNHHYYYIIIFQHNHNKNSPKTIGSASHTEHAHRLVKSLDRSDKTGLRMVRPRPIINVEPSATHTHTP